MPNRYKALVPFTSQFSGQDITTVIYDGRPCWIAKDVGQALGYGNGGQKLAQRITQDWGNDFIEGTDYALISGRELSEFKKLLKRCSAPVPVHARHLMVLFETGVRLASMKTRKAAGQRLRRWLASEISPQVQHVLDFGSNGPMQPCHRLVVVGAKPSAIAAAREERLTRQMRCQALRELADTLEKANCVDQDVVDNLRISAAEAALGEDLSDLMLPTEGQWPPSPETLH